jgi:DNA polymerase (family X)
VDKHAIALVLDEIGTLLDLHGENAFKARAFQAAARAIERTEDDVSYLARNGKLESIAGIGPATARVIRELVDTGTAKFYLDLRQRTPSGFYELLAVPKLGAKRIRILHEKLGIQSIADLERAAREGQIAQLPGFGGRTQELLLEGIKYVRGTLGRRRLAEALDVGPRLLGFVSAMPGVVAAEVVGELRRRMETVDGIDLVAGVRPDHQEQAIKLFLELPGVMETGRLGADGAFARLSDGFMLRLRCVLPEHYPAAVVAATGSEAHVQALQARARQQNQSLDEMRVRGEAELYEQLGLQFVPPELRETGAEIEVALAQELPTLIEFADLRGCFHCHTVYSDGRHTVAEMAEAARQRKWRYLGIADHSKNAGYAGGLSADQIARQQDEIDEWNAANGNKLWVFKGIEADILTDGRLDYEDEPTVLESFDFVVGSVHSSFNLPVDTMTARLVRAMQNPALTFLGHATGRLLLSRAGYRIDVETVMAAAVQLGVAIEINSDPHRLDLDWRYWRRGKQLGVRTAINPDAHSTRSLGVVEYGVYMARKGWLEKSDVVNAWTLAAVRKFLQARKGAGEQRP